MADGAFLSIDLDLGAVEEAVAAIGLKNLPNTARAVEQATLLVQRLWMQAASGAEVSYHGQSFTVKRRSGAYARSIADGLEYPADGDPLTGRVSADTPYAEAIEKGVAAHDMKPALLGGPRARLAKDGTRYAIVPFRHNTPGAGATGQAMPVDVYQRARKLDFTAVTGHRPDRNPRGETVQRAVYRHGGQLRMRGVGHVEEYQRSRIGPPEHRYTHQSSIYSGMVKTGAKGQAGYMTFRVVSERSPENAWWHPGTPPRPISEAVAQMAEKDVTELIRQGFEKDMELLAGGAV
jgi:hypothetical protein